MLRGHQPVTIEEFNGLFDRGDTDSCPPDHFPDCNNIQFIQSGFETRDALETFLADNLGLGDVLRMYTFVQETGQSVLALDSNGNIYDVNVTALTVGGPILHVDGMTDFGFVSINGRAYLTPCNSETGLENEFVYVYAGDGTPARKAAGVAPTDADGALAAASGGAGFVEAGVHVFGVVYETDTGFLTSIGPDTLAVITAPGSTVINLTNVPVSPNSYVTKRRIVATRAINPLLYTGDTRGYDFFFVPDAVIENNTGTTITVSFFDSELLEDASHLQDLYEEIPATVGLNIYHERMIAYATFDDISLCLVSFPGEPEAISQIDGLIVFPLDGKPITNGQEFRDVLYLFKQTKTNAWTDNGDVPSAWPLTVLDQGIGAATHGIATVLDSGGVNVDFLQIVDYSGIMLFDGAYKRPELSWKIQRRWLLLNRNFFTRIEIKNDPLAQRLYITLPDRQMYMGDYSNGMDPKNIRWSPWSFDVEVNSIALINTNTLLIGSAAEA